MKSQPILQVAVPTPLRKCFDYLPPQNYQKNQLQPGNRIEVPFGKKRVVIGIITKITNNSAIAINELKSAIRILDDQPLFSEQLLQLINWTSTYYHHSLGEVFANAMPKLLREGRPLTGSDSGESDPVSGVDPITLNEHQQQAVNTITTSSGFKTFLLDGVTGSGKTEVYLAVIKQLAPASQVLVLVPEIGLTPQTVARFKSLNKNVQVLHSKLTPLARFNNWLSAKQGLTSIIIGTRSAIFTPLPNLKLIIVDEEHDASFKQQSGLRYSARDVAIMRAKLANIPIILGSATPSLESLANANNNRYIRLPLPERAANAKHPTFKIVDIKNKRLRGGLAPQLIEEIQQQITKKTQVLLFLNRRGFAPALLCHTCGWVGKCQNCDAKLTIHKKNNYLHCHHCGATKPIYKTCPQCSSEHLIAIGIGTERLTEKITTLFPDTNILRIDSDTTRRKGSIEKMLGAIKADDCQILIGTQMLAKGHHFPNVTMVVMVDADSGLLSSDFRAEENIAQLIIQVAGRAGRAEKPGTVYIQTHNPSHPLLQYLITAGYHKFAKVCLLQRKQANLPPFAHFVLLRAKAKQNTPALEFLTIAKKIADAEKISAIQILGPIPAPMHHKASFYHAHLLITSNNREKLHKLLTCLIIKLETNKLNSKVKWSLDVDPIDMF